MIKFLNDIGYVGYFPPFIYKAKLEPGYFHSVLYKARY